MKVQEAVQRWLVVTLLALLALWLQPVQAQAHVGGEVSASYGCQSSWGGNNYYARSCTSLEEFCARNAQGRTFREIHVSRSGWTFCNYTDDSLDVAGYANLPGDASCRAGTEAWYDKVGMTHCACLEGRQSENDQCVGAVRITLSGPGSVKALPAGPAAALLATVTRDGAPLMGREVLIRMEGGGVVGGVTDAAGQVGALYIPPRQQRAQVNVSANCGGCTNTATLQISVQAAAAPQSCESGQRLGNPIVPGTGEKVQDITDWQDAGAHGLHWSRHYRSQGNVASGLGGGWSHRYAAQVSNGLLERSVWLGDGGKADFQRPNTGTPWQASNGIDSLQETAQGVLYTRGSDQSRWQLGLDGQLQSITQRNGWTMSLGYSGGRLASITNAFGRSLRLAHDAQGRLSKVIAPDGQTMDYGYDSQSRLVSMSYSDGGGNGAGANVQTYHYEDPRWADALTGIAENHQRVASYSYDAQGRAVSTRHAAGADSYTLQYGAEGTASGELVPMHGIDPAIYRVTVQATDPLGNPQTWTYQGGDGQIRLLGAGAGYAGGQIASRSFGAQTLAASETDFLGNTTLYTWDATRRLKTGETRAAGRPEAQTEQTEWHPTLRLPEKITEAGRTTAYTYDAWGNKLTETVTDLATGEARTWRWTWDTRQLLATHTEPGGGVWTYTQGAQGLPVRIVNPLGHATGYAYDDGGRVIRIERPGLAAQVNRYDARGRLTAQSTASGDTRYGWSATGQLASITEPQGYKVSYQYDAAQRLIAAADNRGNSVQYTLDAAGNRVREEIRDGSGAIAQVTSRAINSLNQVSAVTGAAGTTQIGYDANGQPISETDPLNQSTRQTLDGLGRVTATTFPDNARATQSWNALDALTQATDPKGVATVYVRNAFGEVMRETSPDAGTTVYTRDANGRVLTRTDALGVVTRITRDALGRPVQITRGASHQTHYRWDSERPGYLAQMDDASGSTVYQRDSEGRVTQKTQRVNDNPDSPSSFKTSYAYAGGELSAITYPSGFKVNYKRDATGRITAIDTQPPGTRTAAFLTELTHTALGQPKAWRWPGGKAASRTFDADGRMTRNEFAHYRYDAAGRMTGITQLLDVNYTPGALQPAGPLELSWTVGYDSRNRIVRFASAWATTLYSYDANGNRLTQQDSALGTHDLDADHEDPGRNRDTRRTLKIDASSNRLLGLSQTQTEVQGTRSTTSKTSVTYSLDAAGNLTSDGLRSFDYDEANRMAKARVLSKGEEARIRYLHNALGQRVFESEVEAERTLPSQAQLGSSFIAWLKTRFGWLFQGTATTSVGTAYVYADDEALPGWAILGSYDNGSASGNGRSEYIWLPTQGGGAIPVGMLRNGKLYAIHTDHLGTPRLMTHNGKPIWQWPYSAFGDNKASGPLKVIGDHVIVRAGLATLRTTTPTEDPGLRLPGQIADPETGTHYNGQRSYCPGCGRYTQADPIGTAGGWNRFDYARQNALSFVDQHGLNAAALPLVVGGGGLLICQADPKCRQKLSQLAQQCAGIANQVKNWVFSEGTDALPTDLTGQNPRDGSGRRVNTDLPGGSKDVFDQLSGGRSTDQGDGTKIAPNGVRWRPGVGDQGPRVDIPANGARPHETIHFPPGG